MLLKSLERTKQEDRSTVSKSNWLYIVYTVTLVDIKHRPPSLEMLKHKTNQNLKKININ